MSDVAPLLAEATEAEEERKTSYLELFFDLVFVFAFTQVTALILEDTSVQGFLRAALVLAMVWWAWSAYTWMTNAIDIENTVTRLILFTAMAAGFFMALAVPDAFQDEAAWFAVAYFVVRVLNSTLFAWGVRGDPRQLRATLRLAPWFLAAAFVALVGGFVDPDYRASVWLTSLLIDVVGTLVVASAGWRVSPSHFAERFALIVIIALGESIVAIGIGTSGLERDATFALSVLVAFVGVVALWWEYFDFTAAGVERSLRRADPRARGPLARDLFTFFHYPVVLGIILYAVAAKKTLEHPTRPALTRRALGARARRRRLLPRSRRHAPTRCSEHRLGAARGGRYRAGGRACARRDGRDRDARRGHRCRRPLGRDRDGTAPGGPRRDPSGVAPSYAAPTVVASNRDTNGRSRQMSEYRQSPQVSGWAAGGVVFAGVMLILIGCFQSIAGLTAIFNDDFFASAANYTFDLDPTAWGWIHLTIGILLILSGLALFSGATWGGAVAITLAVLSAVSNFFFIPYYPFWSILEIALACWVIWAITRPGALQD